MAGPSYRRVAWAAATVAWLVAGGCSDPTASLGSGSTEETIKALRACTRTRDPDVVDRVADAVSHRDTMVAAEAVRCLGRMRTDPAVEVLEGIAAGDRDRRSALRQEAVIQLGRQRQASDTARATLREVVQLDPDPRVRAAAATSLAQHRSLLDVPLLIEVAERETDRVVQARAVGAVERLVGLRFGYDPTASKAERQGALQRLRRIATPAAASVRRVREQQ